MAKRFTEKTKELARIFVIDRINYFNRIYGFKINRVAIKNTKTRWGSCSSKANLNFNYKIIFLKPELANYLIVHELCHLGELNHSKKYWDLVKKAIPDYRRLNAELKRINTRLI